MIDRGISTLIGSTGFDTFDLTPAGEASTTVCIQCGDLCNGADWVTGIDPVECRGHCVVSVNQIHAADGVVLVDNFVPGVGNCLMPTGLPWLNSRQMTSPLP